MRKVVVLGSTGSIGTQTLDVCRQFPDRLEVVGLAAGRNEPLLLRQAQEFRVKRTVLFERGGMNALVDLATLPEADWVVVAVAGVIGLLPTFEAIRAGKHIALASKEVLVSAGSIVMPMLQEFGVMMTPIDSEHSAIFQCLQGHPNPHLDELILTASGGPFRGKRRADLTEITADQALNHPTWKMGGKITIDSATLMNKGLEMIEAHWLFGVPIERVKVVIHPQSIVHSMVKFTDGSVIGQLGWPDMRLPIAYALFHPDRPANHLEPWYPWDSPSLTFEKPDEETFESLSLAREAARVGGTLPCALNAANEAGVAAFLDGKLSFLGIPKMVARVMQEHRAVPATLESILGTDRWARERVFELVS